MLVFKTNWVLKTKPDWKVKKVKTKAKIDIAENSRQFEIYFWLKS